MGSQTISILGCGWLGLPLAEFLTDKKFLVKGSTTDVQKFTLLEKKGVAPYFIDCQPQINADYDPSFFDSDILFINIPYKRSLTDPAYYQRQIDSVVQCALEAGVKHIIFASSTSVYPNTLKDAREDASFAPANKRAEILLGIEEALLNNANFKTTVIRFAGLYGGERRIGRFHSKRRIVENGLSPVNLIHLDDCVGIVEKVIRLKKYNEIFNAVSDEHPVRKDLYSIKAKELGVQAPEFADNPDSPQRIVNNTKLKKLLEYKFKYPDPMKS